MEKQRLSRTWRLPLTKQRLSKTGQRRLTFMGAEIFSGSTKTPESEVWHVVRVFETENDFVVGISRKTTWDNQTDTYDRIRTDNELELISIIAQEVPDLDITELSNHGKEKEETERNQPIASQESSPGLLSRD